LISYPTRPKSDYVAESVDSSPELGETVFSVSSKANQSAQHWSLFAASIFLVSVPVFIQTPLVRLLPWVSLALTLVLAMVGVWLRSRFASRWWGDLCLGFTWTWLAGSLYWGWLRWEPLLHLPVEAIGMPFAVWGISRKREQIGHFFYLGSLFGTAVTDLYFYLNDLIPYWRKLMQVDGDSVGPIFKSALAQMQTSWGFGWAVILAVVLLGVSVLPLRSRQDYWWAFSGAVLSTILVDALFWFAATSA
jgi:hypothetical protein